METYATIRQKVSLDTAESNYIAFQVVREIFEKEWPYPAEAYIDSEGNIVVWNDCGNQGSGITTILGVANKKHEFIYDLLKKLKKI